MGQRRVNDAKVRIYFHTSNDLLVRYLLSGIQNVKEIKQTVSERVEKLLKAGMEAEDQIKLCEVCSKEEAKFQCQFCGKWLCPECLGTFLEIRKCCGKEDEITKKARANKLHLRQIE
jgi:methionyl-tRNA synthetase